MLEVMVSILPSVMLVVVFFAGIDLYILVRKYLKKKINE